MCDAEETELITLGPAGIGGFIPRGRRPLEEFCLQKGTGPTGIWRVHFGLSGGGWSGDGSGTNGQEAENILQVASTRTEDGRGALVAGAGLHAADLEMALGWRGQESHALPSCSGSAPLHVFPQPSWEMGWPLFQPRKLMLRVEGNSPQVIPLGGRSQDSSPDLSSFPQATGARSLGGGWTEGCAGAVNLPWV